MRAPAAGELCYSLYDDHDPYVEAVAQGCFRDGARACAGILPEGDRLEHPDLADGRASASWAPDL